MTDQHDHTEQRAGLASQHAESTPAGPAMTAPMTQDTCVIAACSEDGHAAVRVSCTGAAQGIEVTTEQGPGMRIQSYGPGLYVDSHDGGVRVTSVDGPSIYAEATRTDAIIASSLGGHGIHAVGGGVSGGMGTNVPPCGIFTEGGCGDGLHATSEQTAVRGVSSAGYGASFAGGRAPLYLEPAATVGAPTTGVHLQGELYVDAAVTLWLCIAEGTPGSWRQIVTT